MKRLLVFLVLLALGFAVLRFAVGDADVAAVKTGGGATSGTAASGNGTNVERQAPAPPASGLRIDQGGKQVTVSGEGPFQYTKTRLLPEVGGHAAKEPVYTLRAANSRPIGNGQQELEGVTLLLFENGAPSGTLDAKRAFVSLRPDANGQRSLDEAKDVDLRDVVFTGTNGNLAGLRLELATAHLKVDDDAMQLTTPRDEPVLVVFEGDRRVTLRGQGAQALLPRTRDAKLRRADVEILQNPVLEAEGLEVRARGRLHFVEEVESGASTVTLDDHVELDLARSRLALPHVGSGAHTPTVNTMHVRGDQFVAWLQRTRGRDAAGKQREARDWRQLALTGAPATVEMPGAHLTSPRITARAGLFGTPELITAHGGESRIEQTELRPGSKQKAPLVGTSSRRLHFAMPREQLGALCASYGMPRWAMRPLERLQIGVVEGTARLQGADDTYEARDGAHLYRFDGSDAGAVVGLGPARIEQKGATPRDDVVATTSGGFAFTQTGTKAIDVTGAPQPAREQLRLGPEAPADPDAPGPWREHTFDVRCGNATVHGNGVGRVERTGARTKVSFVAPDGRITAVLPDHGLQLRRVRWLETEIVDNEAVQLDAAGWPIEVSVADGKDGALAKAPRVEQIGPRSLRLQPPDPQRPALWSGLPAAERLPLLRREIAATKSSGPQQIEVRGPCIDVHHAGGRDVLVDASAVAGELPHAYARIAPVDGGEATTLACAAERLRVLPFVVSPAMRRFFTAGNGALAAVAFHALREPWLVVDEVRDFQLDDPKQGHVEGHGKRLFATQAARAVLFLGDPDAPAPAEIVRTVGGRVTTVRGAQVRALDDGGVRLEALGGFHERSTFLPPSVTLRDPQRTGLLSHMQATCRGNIEVRPDEVRFFGPVTAHSLADDGSIDPNGVTIEAATLHMTRDSKGDLRLVTGTDVVADWPRLHAQSKDLEIDVGGGHVVANDPKGAFVRLASGYEITSPHVEANYHTLVFFYSGGHIVRRDPGARRQ